MAFHQVVKWRTETTCSGMRWSNAFERVLVDGDVTPKTIAERLDLGEHRSDSGRRRRAAAVPTVLNQRMTDEEFSGEDRIDVAG